MYLKVPHLLAEREMTAYALHKESGGRISLSTAYRLATGDFREVSSGVLDALCDIFGIDNPGPLFERKRTKPEKVKK